MTPLSSAIDTVTRLRKSQKLTAQERGALRLVLWHLHWDDATAALRAAERLVAGDAGARWELETALTRLGEKAK